MCDILSSASKWLLCCLSSIEAELLRLSLLIMSEGSAGLEIQRQRNKTRPNLVGFYKSEIIDLLTQDEKFHLLSSSAKEAGDASSDTIENGKGMDAIFSVSSSFSNGIENAISAVNKELLKTSLRQCVRALVHEVDEVIDPVISIRQVISCLNSRRKENSSPKASILGGSTTSHGKQLKASCSISREGRLVDQSRDAEKETDSQVNEDLKLLLESDPILVEGIITKQSDELHEMLDHLEGQLEELLYAIVSKCRPMTQPEKRHLLKLIEKLPAKKLNRIVEILQHGKSSDNVSLHTISVDLEEQENTTLWRLYIYVKAVENARKLSA